MVSITWLQKYLLKSCNGWIHRSHSLINEYLVDTCLPYYTILFIFTRYKTSKIFYLGNHWVLFLEKDQIFKRIKNLLNTNRGFRLSPLKSSWNLILFWTKWWHGRAVLRNLIGFFENWELEKLIFKEKSNLRISVLTSKKGFPQKKVST